MFGRKELARTHKRKLLDELTESYGHLKLAAGHAAGGAAEKVTPTYDKARLVASRGWHTTKDAFNPLYSQVKEGAANARKETQVSKKNRWPALVGLLAAGAAVGAAGAMVARRRRISTTQWDEYEPLPTPEEPAYGSTADSAKDRVSAATSSATKKVTEGAASVADSVSTQAGKIAETLHEKAERIETSPPGGGTAGRGTSAAPGSGAPGGAETMPSGAPVPGPADFADDASLPNTKNPSP